MSEASFIEEIAHGSVDYRAMLEWRARVLRHPLGLELSAADVAGEDAQRHFVLREGNAILAGVIAVAREPGTMRLRQMWVRDDAAGQGLGRSLLQAVERVLSAEGCQRITLHARVVVRGFYEKCGYALEGREFEEIGIAHITMTRWITSE